MHKLTPYRGRWSFLLSYCNSESVDVQFPLVKDFPEPVVCFEDKPTIVSMLLPIAKKWKELGFEMGIDQTELAQIEDHKKSDKERLMSLISQHEYKFAEQIH